MKTKKNNNTFAQRAKAIQAKYKRANFDAVERQDLANELRALVKEQEEYKLANGIDTKAKMVNSDGQEVSGKQMFWDGGSLYNYDYLNEEDNLTNKPPRPIIPMWANKNVKKEWETWDADIEGQNNWTPGQLSSYSLKFMRNEDRWKDYYDRFMQQMGEKYAPTYSKWHPNNFNKDTSKSNIGNKKEFYDTWLKTNTVEPIGGRKMTLQLLKKHRPADYEKFIEDYRANGRNFKVETNPIPNINKEIVVPNDNIKSRTMEDFLQDESFLVNDVALNVDNDKGFVPVTPADYAKESDDIINLITSDVKKKNTDLLNSKTYLAHSNLAKKPARLTRIFGILGNLPGLLGKYDIEGKEVERVNPELINLEREREIARRQAQASKNIMQSNLRNTPQGNYLSNMAAGSASVDSALGDILGQSYLKEEVSNADIINRAKMFNSQMQGQNDALNYQIEANNMANRANAIQGMLKSQEIAAGKWYSGATDARMLNSYISDNGYRTVVDASGNYVRLFDPNGEVVFVKR